MLVAFWALRPNRFWRARRLRPDDFTSRLRAFAPTGTVVASQLNSGKGGGDAMTYGFTA
jgi:hypothetical protein